MAVTLVSLGFHVGPCGKNVPGQCLLWSIMSTRQLRLLRARNSSEVTTGAH